MQKADEIVPASAINQKPKAFCDESGVGFGAIYGEFKAALVAPFNSAE